MTGTEHYKTVSIRLFPDLVQEEYFHKACAVSTHIYNMAKQWDDEFYAENKGKEKKRLNQRDITDRLNEYKAQREKDGDPLGVESHTLKEGIFRYLKARDRAFKKINGFPNFSLTGVRGVNPFTFVRTT